MLPVIAIKRKGTCMRIKRMIVASLGSLLLIFGMSALVGCGPSSKDLVEQGVTTELDSIKSLDTELLTQLSAVADVDGLASYGIDATEFLSSYLSGFDYQLGDIVVDGNTAKATVSLTCKSYESLAASLTEKISARSLDEGVANMNEEEISQLVGTTFADSLAELKPVAKSPVELEFALQDKAWSLTENGKLALSKALFEA